MKKIYRHTERLFETVALTAIAILGNSITFIIALLTVIIWLVNKPLFNEDIHARIGEVILGITFLSMFIIQKSFNRFSASLHLKVNELVSSHEPASNEVIQVGNKTEHEIAQFSRENEHTSHQNDSTNPTLNGSTSPTLNGSTNPTLNGSANPTLKNSHVQRLRAVLGFPPIE